MARLEQADPKALPPEFQERFDVVERSNGYIPNSYLLLAHRPPILQAFMDLSKAVIRDEGTLDRGFRFLVADKFDRVEPHAGIRSDLFELFQPFAAQRLKFRLLRRIERCFIAVNIEIVDFRAISQNP